MAIFGQIWSNFGLKRSICVREYSVTFGHSLVNQSKISRTEVDQLSGVTCIFMLELRSAQVN